MSDAPPLLEARGITKAYPGTVALDDVNFAVRAGEIHALMGENGAGKSTLIKILTGAVRRDFGAILIDGRPAEPDSTPRAQQAGIWAVHQEVMVLPNLSVAENVMLGCQPRRFGLVDRRKTRRLANQALAELGLSLDMDRELGSFPVAIRQLVAIARAVRANARVLVLDEPTASLDAPEVERLFDVVRALASRGTGIVFITHFLDQVYALSDRITVLRNGKAVGSSRTQELPQVDLIHMMIGKGLEQAIERERPANAKKGNVAASFVGLGKTGLVEPFDITLHAGEAVGAAGLLGSGRTETAMLMFGAERADTGSVEIDGKPRRLRSPRDAIRAGLAFSPEDRKADGIFGDLSIRDNIAIVLQSKRGWARKLSRRKQQRLADEYIARLNVKTPDADKPIGQLSGGNQQKALLARWLASDPKVLILDEPTRGIDVGAHADIVKAIEELRDSGLALYVISSELEELVAYSERVSVMRDRRQVALLERDELSVDRIVAAIAASSGDR
ncbi:sugar ABC transporter ATP-binding protein [Sphingomonas daechungensis]|uniref:Sugar ABC transporter ATP-binding protein n=1 Tax=Sphingomonas daechungensis TaxID=1176646 RepID=A0ABX6T2P9_9SPHN|nr:sugar ABC transporter ATP-binding protein [Sphingomonas daechungensis]QNP43498.1 sugar ABC transporter ATP-binding protein [Sphingomonas daechungensis]